MNLAKIIAQECQIDPNKILLLRHSTSKLNLLDRSEYKSISVHDDYTCVQPTDSIYDYLSSKYPKIRVEVVVVVKRDLVDGVYWIKGVAKTGTTYNLVSQEFRDFDKKQENEERPAKRFILEKKETMTEKCKVKWSSPRHPVARFGNRLFETVSVDLTPGDN